MKKLIFVLFIVPAVVFMLITVSNAVNKMTQSVVTLSSTR